MSSLEWYSKFNILSVSVLFLLSSLLSWEILRPAEEVTPRGNLSCACHSSVIINSLLTHGLHPEALLFVGFFRQECWRISISFSQDLSDQTQVSIAGRHFALSHQTFPAVLCDCSPLASVLHLMICSSLSLLLQIFLNYWTSSFLINSSFSGSFSSDDCAVSIPFFPFSTSSLLCVIQT